MPQGCACHLPFLEGSTGGREKFLQGVCIPILDYLIQFQFKIVGVMNISFFLIFYHLIRLLVKALQCELVIFQKEPFCGDSLVVEALMEKYQAGGLHRAILRTVPCFLKRLHSLWRNSELVLR